MLTKKELQEFWNANKQELMTLIVLANIVKDEEGEDLIPIIARAKYVVDALLFWDAKEKK